MLARMIGMQDRVIDDTCEETCDYKQAAQVCYEDFQIIYFAMFSRVQPEPLHGDLDYLNATDKLGDLGALLDTEYDK